MKNKYLKVFSAHKVSAIGYDWPTLTRNYFYYETEKNGVYKE
jgi:hypothetical protein